MSETSMTTALVPVPLTPESVFRAYGPRIFYLAKRMIGNDADAEDVTSEVLMQVVRKLHTFRGDSSLSTWLHKITVNAALALREKRANRAKRETATGDDVILENHTVESSNRVRLDRPQAHQTPDDIVLADEQRQLIEEAIAKLPTPFRDVYVLADIEGLPNQEIAEILDLSLAAVKSRLHRARLKMRDLLEPHFDSEGVTR